jgi:hypothetical protein
MNEPGAIKYGPLTIHQNGQIVKTFQATPTPVVGRSTHVAHSLENVRLSLHVERFESQERYSADMTCIIRFPEYGYELKQQTPCEMRAGQTHGTAVVPVTCICVDFQDPHDTVMEVEYLMGDASLDKQSVSIKFPTGNDQEEGVEKA